MRAFYRKEGPGLYSVLRFLDENKPNETIAIFSKEVDARRMVDAVNRSMTSEEETKARARNA